MYYYVEMPLKVSVKAYKNKESIKKRFCKIERGYNIFAWNSGK
ncbi:hypothetical protein BAOM_2117 [Peribacillus asahii]|uniref:Uncharacterized protein n=1 Tax=Peribacillus asahii TaxID=228899 RepID=A0A3Q9RMM3_9BACI|nr:hypothetical protein BAOM_2117 [Peribacillus asahii]